MNAAKSLQRNVVTRHRHLSASNDVLSTLPERVVKGFPLVMQQRSDFTLRVFGYVITGTYQGQNFIELSRGIAPINYREYMRNNRDSKEATFLSLFIQAMINQWNCLTARVVRRRL